jgi:hypothetical protein
MKNVDNTRAHELFLKLSDGSNIGKSPDSEKV